MIEAGILDGDIVVVQRAQDARKRRHRRRARRRRRDRRRGDREDGSSARTAGVRLQPENAALEPIYAGHVQMIGKVIGVFRSADEPDAAHPLARPGAARARFAARASSASSAASSSCTRLGAIACPECEARRSARGARKPSYNSSRRPGDRGALARRSRKVRTPKGRTLGQTQAAKADGKWHRKETAAGDDSPETPAVRVKRWGKSPPASWRHGGSPNPVRCKAKQVPTTAARRGAGSARPQRGWSPSTESGLQVSLRKTSQTRGFRMTFRYGIVTGTRVRQLSAVSLEPLGRGARPSAHGCAGNAPLRTPEATSPTLTLSRRYLRVRSNCCDDELRGLLFGSDLIPRNR